MPELVSKYRIFLASPSDLMEEREAIDEVVSELNNTYGLSNNIVLELLKWEKNSAPGISLDGIQSIINTDIPKYDLFIGLLWMRFGTPTESFGSGTEEEFEIAYKRYISNEEPIQILFYFKNSPPQSLDNINIEQLSKVRVFKEGLKSKNVFTWNFNLKEELEKYLRTHIPSRISTLVSNSKLPALKVESNIESKKL